MYTLKKFCRHYTASAIPRNTTTFINEPTVKPTVKGHFGVMCKACITIIPSNKFTC